MIRRISNRITFRLAVLALAFIISACDNNPLQKKAENPLPGRIVFSAKQEGSNYNQIFMVNADGTNLQQVTFFADNNANKPSWSPYGDYIVFASDSVEFRGAGVGMFIVAADGSGITRVKKDSLHFTIGDYSVWSPAGDQMATFNCGSCRSAGSGSITIRNLDEGWLWGYIRGGYPAWSPDGGMQAFVANDLETAHMQIFVAEVAIVGPYFQSVRLTVTPVDKRTPVWSPVDTHIAFISDTHILIHHLASGTERKLVTVDVPAGQVPFELHAWVGENGEHLLATFEDKANLYYRKYYLYAVNVQSGGLTLIVPDSTIRGADWHLPQ